MNSTMENGTWAVLNSSSSSWSNQQEEQLFNDTVAIVNGTQYDGEQELLDTLIDEATIQLNFSKESTVEYAEYLPDHCRVEHFDR